MNVRSVSCNFGTGFVAKVPVRGTKSEPRGYLGSEQSKQRWEQQSTPGVSGGQQAQCSWTESKDGVVDDQRRH